MYTDPHFLIVFPSLHRLMYGVSGAHYKKMDGKGERKKEEKRRKREKEGGRRKEKDEERDESSA